MEKTRNVWMGVIITALALGTVGAYVFSQRQDSTVPRYEAIAGRTMLKLAAADQQYFRLHGRYAPSLSDLQSSVLLTESDDEDVRTSIKSTLEIGRSNEYFFDYQATDTLSGSNHSGFVMIARPVQVDKTGVRFYYIDQTGILRYAYTTPNQGSKALN